MFRLFDAATRLARADAASAVLFLVLILAPAAATGDGALQRFRMFDEPVVSERVIVEEEWAAELVHALGLADALPSDPSVDELFALLCADDAERVTESGGRRVPSGSAFRAAVEAPRPRRPNDAVRAVVNVPGTALYALTVEGVGAQRWKIDQRVVGHLDLSTLGVAQGPRLVALRAGPHEVAAYLAGGAQVYRFELTAHRPLCIAPAGGWQASRPLTFGANARTLVRALGLERRLPVQGDAIAIEGEGFQSASAWGGRTNREGDSASSGSWAMAVGSAAEFSYRTRLDRPGVFSLMARTHGAPDQIWSIDGRYRVTATATSGDDGFDWTHVMTIPLDAGEHTIRALLPRDSGIDEMRLVRRRSGDAQYIAVLREAGFDVGFPSQPVTQTDAYASLANPLFAELSSHFLARMAGPGTAQPGWVLDAELAADTAPAVPGS